jgi:hypothetical protein
MCALVTIHGDMFAHMVGLVVLRASSIGSGLSERITEGCIVRKEPLASRRGLEEVAEGEGTTRRVFPSALLSSVSADDAFIRSGSQVL